MHIMLLWTGRTQVNCENWIPRKFLATVLLCGQEETMKTIEFTIYGKFHIIMYFLMSSQPQDIVTPRLLR